MTFLNLVRTDYKQTFSAMACRVNYVCFFFCQFAFIVSFCSDFLKLDLKQNSVTAVYCIQVHLKVHSCLQQRVKASVISVKWILIRSEEHIKEFEEVNF